MVLCTRSTGSSKTDLKIESLPPTESAEGHHAERFYVQVIEWKHQDRALKLQLVDWGWQMKNGKLFPSMIMHNILFKLLDVPAKPQVELLKVVRAEKLTALCVCIPKFQY